MTTGTVKVGDTITGTTQSHNYTQSKIEYGWECPRCGHINAPWVRQCDCPRNYQSNTITWTNGTSIPDTYININGTLSNKAEPDITAWNCTNPNNCHTPHYTTKTVVNG